jgi:dihydrorhizobitoxine desaturase
MATRTHRPFSRYRFSPEICARIKELNRSDNWHSLGFLAIDVLWIAGCIAACVYVSWWLYPLAALLIGARQRALSTIFHDCVHGVAASSKALRLVLGTVLTAYPIFQSYCAYKLSHVFGHHPYLGDPDRDPDLQYFRAERIYERTPRSRSRWRLVVLPILGARTLSFLGYLFRTRFQVQRRRHQRGDGGAGVFSRRVRALDKAGFWLFWGVVVLVAYLTGTLLHLVLFWVVPYLTTFQLLSWFIELSEHTPLFCDHDVDLYMTRNRKSRGLEKLLTGIHNDHYHWDHHLDTRTPCWNLPAAHAIRMADPRYAELDRATGGLFVAGREAQPSIVTVILDAVSTPEEERDGELA